MSKKLFPYKHYLNKPEYLFASGEEAWLWFCRLNYAESSGAYCSEIAPPCETNDIYRIITRLVQERRIRKEAIRVLVKYGRKQEIPDTRFGGSMNECLDWKQAMNELESVLDNKGLLRHDTSALYSA
jgi:hypothetical protein